MPSEKKKASKGEVKDESQIQTKFPRSRHATLLFDSKATGKRYFFPPSTTLAKLPRDPFVSWCFKTGRWVDSRSNVYPCSLHQWSSTLHNELIDHHTIVILDDKEVAMMDRMLGGKRVEGCSAFKHLSETCNLEDSLIRAYVKLGKEVDGHPVSLKILETDEC